MYTQSRHTGAQSSFDLDTDHLYDDAGRVLTPKKPLSDKAGGADIFPYYAGFSFDWARELIRKEKTADKITVLDPWNGSGTTTLAAQSLGYPSIGIDLNPVAEIVANVRTRQASSDVEQRAPSRPKTGLNVPVDDPLSCWFRPPSVRRLRGWLAAYAAADDEVYDIGRVATFLAVQSLTRGFQGSNPTWVKVARTPDEQIYVPARQIDDQIRSYFAFIASRTKGNPVKGVRALHLRGSSKSLPLKDDSISSILTSPPYLTRIDYAIAYRRELAVLGIDTRNKANVRAALMGTTAIRGGTTSAAPKVQSIASSLLKEIAEHPSYASATYYSKQAVQYFGDLIDSLKELTRVARPGASMTLVVQDSFYKDILVPLADICVEESQVLGWEAARHRRDPVKRSMGSLNIAAKNYRKSTVTESAITLRKPTRRGRR